MQVLETEVRRGGATPTVAFHGEGGESVAVTFAKGMELDDRALVEKARATLVQVARFGEMDHGIRQALPADAKPPQHYTLEYQDKGEVRTVSGVLLDSLELVEGECQRSAKDLWEDALSRGEAPVGWAVRARDQNGEVVASVDFEDLQQESAQTRQMDRATE
jgi:hypothetical protein